MSPLSPLSPVKKYVLYIAIKKEKFFLFFLFFLLLYIYNIFFLDGDMGTNLVFFRASTLSTSPQVRGQVGKRVQNSGDIYKNIKILKKY